MAAGGRNYVIYVPAAHQKSRIRHPHLPMPLAIAIEHIINIYADSCLFFYTHTRKLCNYLCLPRLLKLFSLPSPPNRLSPAGGFPCLGKPLFMFTHMNV